jgi:hypothetical protein
MSEFRRLRAVTSRGIAGSTTRLRSTLSASASSCSVSARWLTSWPRRCSALSIWLIRTSCSSGSRPPTSSPRSSASRRAAIDSIDSSCAASWLRNVSIFVST